MAFSIYKAICVAISHDQVQCVVNLFMHVNDFTNAKGNARNLCLQGTVARFKIISFSKMGSPKESMRDLSSD